MAACKAGAVPIGYIPMFSCYAGQTGFEPITYRLGGGCSSFELLVKVDGARYSKGNCSSSGTREMYGIRTRGLLVDNQVL